jgi:hypothetical protein
LSHEDQELSLALISIYSKPDPTLLHLSVSTLWSCKHLGDSALRFIDIKSIQSVVAMIPHRPTIGGQSCDRFFLVEKPGLDIALMGGIEDEMQEEESDD